MSFRTADERQAALEQALRRSHEGYVLPAIPDTREWNEAYDVFARDVSIVFQQRYTDCYRVTVSDETYARRNLDFTAVRKAVDGKDYDLVAAYHRLLMSSPTPDYIKPALEILSTVHDEVELTAEHVAVYGEIRKAFESWRDDHYRADAENAFFSLVQLCYEDFSTSRTSTIIQLIGRGIHNKEKVRAALETFTDIESPLLNGAL